ncbi:hypothetical protein TPHA_0A01740 [Tetrapisispora phaffii CBS 4417]|uniref:Uncharacterized protein n=1 Tax=Tetrapisispora phaffii (strain ATCC 24235 / CBS 4417 / NBRC 1672 / NRRL Y-8282 / UCD 70-5) TaxID=1071381 RepID=G8BMX9_TETPH|nr:hypothetical protein TPHA_0A01740 [Tetrapisispora phaffii CBS 4417]CCE61257.1 hypothetical protein TPHA_0A01740 [Tetrapisispora phaffii CBS 4417]
MFSKIISQSTARIANRQIIRHSSNAAKTPGSSHLGESWILTEAKRVGPNLLFWGSAMTTVLLWPSFIKYFKDPNYKERY